MTDAIQPGGGPSLPPNNLSAEATQVDNSEAIQTARPEPGGDDTFPIPIPPPPPPGRSVPEASTATLRRPVAWLEGSMVALLLVLAFFVGSFVTNHSSVWSHLASGRLLAQGAYHFGTDPFCSTTAGVYWANASWLYDLVTFLIYKATDGAGLVVVKALLGVLLTVVLLRIRRPGASWWPSVICIGLALLAMSPRLHLDSFVCSLLFLGLTVSVLFREPLRHEAGPGGAADQPPRWSRCWLLPLLFALWANIDGWFLMGPLAVALALVGELLQRLGQPAGAADASFQARRLRTLALVLPVGLAACLLNPHLHHVFVLPPELADLVLRTGGWLPASMLTSATNLHAIGQHDPQILQVLAYYWQSPFSVDYWSSPARGLNVAGLAYYPLLVLGLVSFALTAGGEGGYRWARLLVWAGFAGLSAAALRAVPLFAVVAAPITALNLQEFAQQWSAGVTGITRFQRAWAIGARSVGVLVLLALTGLAWLGLLHAYPYEPRLSRHVGWEVRPDPLIVQAAKQLDAWHGDGKLARAFNFNPDFANYCAWFAPRVKPFFDYRFDLVGSVAEDIGRLRNALREVSESRPGSRGGTGDSTAAGTARALLHKYHIDHVVLTGPDPVSARLAVRLIQDWREWSFLYGDGKAQVFGWCDPRAPGQVEKFRRMARNPSRLAFGKRAPEPELPTGGPRPFLEEREAWRELLFGPPAPAAGLEEARYWLAYFNLLGDPYLRLLKEPGFSLWQIPGQAGGLTLGLSGAWAAAAPNTLFVTGAAEMRLPPDDLGPPGAPLLAVQATRRALAADPFNAEAYRALADAYQELNYKQEQFWAPHSGDDVKGLRRTLRRLQRIAAAKEALRLQPNSPDVHQALAQIYFQDLYYLDVALEHLSAAKELLDKQQPEAGQAQALKRRREQMARSVKNLTEEVNRRRNYFDVQALGQKLSTKVLLALQAPYRATDDKGQQAVDPRGLGLARQALKILQEASVARLADEEYPFAAAWEMQLLLELGEVRELAQTLDDAKLETGPVRNAYQQTRLFLAAILGDYSTADKILAEMELPPQEMRKRNNALALALAANLLIDPRVVFQPLVRITDHLNLQARLAPSLARMAESQLLRGLLALEHGDTAGAYKHFREADDVLGSWAYFPDRPLLRRYIALLEENRDTK
jgi:hypothetical protein